MTSQPNSASNKTKKSPKGDTRFERRMNWLKDHKVISWVLVVGVVGGAIWSFIPAPVKEIVNDKISALATHSNDEKVKTFIANYYRSVENGDFKAINYFAPHVDKYLLVSNPTLKEIDSYFVTNGMEFLSPHTELFDSTLTIMKDAEGTLTVTVWAAYTCFRKSKKKHESCRTLLEFVLNKDNKIISLIERKHEDLRFENKELLFEGTVGKLPAVFNLTFDYERNLISGTYYYPTRQGVIYELDGSIAGSAIALTEKTSGAITAKCTLSTVDNHCFEGTMHNTDGRNLKMRFCTAESTYLGL